MQKFKVSFYLKKDRSKNIPYEELKDTRWPIYLRVYINGKRTMKATGHEVESKFWDAKKQIIKSTHSNATSLNFDLVFKRNQLVTYLIEQQIKGEEISAVSAKKALQSG